MHTFPFILINFDTINMRKLTNTHEQLLVVDVIVYITDVYVESKQLYSFISNSFSCETLRIAYVMIYDMSYDVNLYDM